MIREFIIYVFAVSGLILGEKRYNVLSMFDISEKLFALFIFIFCIVLLYVGFKRQTIRGDDYALLKKKCFSFSFLVGLFWGIIMSYSEGPLKMNDSILLLINYIVIGVIFGFIGLFLNKLMWIFRKESCNSK
jgi:hypothetical protein